MCFNTSSRSTTSAGVPLSPRVRLFGQSLILHISYGVRFFWGQDHSAKRMRLINKIKEACARNGGGTVALFCDEAQRYDENEYE